MQEFSSVTASSYDAESLAPLLNEKAGEGWEVVSIVAAGTNIVAYLSRESDGEAAPAADVTDTADAGIVADEPETTPPDDTPYVPAAAAAAGTGAAALVADDAAADAPSDPLADSSSEAAAEEPAAVDEPAGWATAPESDTTDTATSEESSIADLASDVGAADATATVAEDAAAEDTATQEPAAESAAAEPAAAESAVPAGWYADPSGRFELRYWDGTAWTEHVSRAGQQFTDPPVA